MNTYTIFCIYFDGSETKFQSFVAKSGTDAIRQANEIYRSCGMKKGRPNGVIRLEAR